MTVLVSPTEPAPIKTLGAVSSLPERYGADVLIVGKWGLFGVQRKEVTDLVASLRGDRVAREIGQQKALNGVVWMIEGNWKWTQDGRSLVVPSFTLTQFRGVLLSLQSHGCWVVLTQDHADTIASVLQLTRYLEKDQHLSLTNRPNPQNDWGKSTSRDWACHLLQSFDGIGPKQAGQIYEHFKGLPMAWTVTQEQLMEVRGIGKARAKTLYEGLNEVPK